jgi:glucosamine--fructose-6-phosphate aminotransferase (isomerizing)
MERAIHTRQEILSQPAAWAQALEVVEQARSALAALWQAEYDQVLFTGCGSTYYLSLAAAALFQETTGRIARAAPGGELLLNPDTILRGGAGPTTRTLLVAVSRSGSTTETVRAVEQFRRQQRGPVIVITNYGEQPLAGLGDVALVIPAGQETSVAQTRSFAAMYVAAAALSLQAAGRETDYQAMAQLPAAGRRLLTAYADLAQEIGTSLAFDRFYFRHGPMSMVNPQAVIVGLVSEKNGAHERTVLNEMRAMGGRILALGESDAEIAFLSGIPEVARAVLYLPVLQLLAWHRSLAKGLNPDQPNNLTAVVTLDL